jgi:type II secretory pathway pseudopilin PulG
MSPRPAARQEGYTLVETLITCLVVSIVLAAAFPVLPVFFRESNIVQNTYQSVDQLVLASEVATRYVHEAVANSPTGNPVLTANANSTTFYANTGNANGPQEIVMQVATSGSSRTFQVNLYTPTGCPFSTTSTNTCTYGSVTQSYLLINNLTNGNGGSPVFTYTLEGGEVCGGPPPGSATTSLSATALNGTTTLHVGALPSAVSVGDSIFLGSGPTAQIVTATANSAVNATTISVTALTSTVSSLTAVYDSALTNVPSTIPTTVSSSSSGTTLHVSSLKSAVTSGDTIVVGTGSTAQTVQATSSVGTSTVATTIPVTALTGTVAAGASVYDSTCSATQVSQISGIALSLVATKNPGGQPTGYQTLAYFLSPEYAATVG